MDAFDDDAIRRLNAAGESDRLERKRGARDLDAIREAVCAFANELTGRRDPAVVIVGIEDDGTCASLAIDDELMRRVSGIRDDGKITPFPDIELRRLEIARCDVLAVVITPAANPPIRFDGRTWVRIGSRNARATPEMEARLIERRRLANLPADARPLRGAVLEDLDLVRFQLEYLPALVSPDTLAENQRGDIQQLRALRLIDDAKVPTLTAILMIGREPQDFVPGAYIAWRRVGGTDLTADTIDDRTISGTLADQLRLADEVAMSYVTTSVEMGASRHERRSEYPIAAIQQIIRNAVMHRAYDGTNAPVRVTWFDDRIEVMSPGGPFGTVTRETLGIPGITDYRNPTIAESLKGYGFVERFGQGLEIARQALARNGNPPLELDAVPAASPVWLIATIRRAR